MEALICPECGGKVDPPVAGSDFAKCPYCATNFKVDRPVPLFSNDAITPVDAPAAGPARSTGIVFITVIVIAVAVFAATRLLSVRNQTNETVNAAQQAANDARSMANAMKKAAEEMTNKAHQISTNVPTPPPPPTTTPTPTQGNHSPVK